MLQNIRILFQCDSNYLNSIISVKYTWKSNFFLSYDEFSWLRIQRISLYYPALFTCIDLTTIVKVIKLCSCHVRWMHFCKILCLNPTFMTLVCSNSVQVRHKYWYRFYPLLVYLWKAGKLVLLHYLNKYDI